MNLKHGDYVRFVYRIRILDNMGAYSMNEERTGEIIRIKDESSIYVIDGNDDTYCIGLSEIIEVI
ncbi:hypothetical protein EDM57_04395 [Brevibacillus gelatini]|uniref:Uncharacterized protein n=1 Tax=Brevibacillus gelatini TaxID=1655277 RepID=A0A3M8B7I8_9BACL|nr:hypothetical protein [Brevibacillus gelatini]RNB59388.1 hypothetical protein EDM57_04395 [Brevibacillus gelatini]